MYSILSIGSPPVRNASMFCSIAGLWCSRAFKLPARVCVFVAAFLTIFAVLMAARYLTPLVGAFELRGVLCRPGILFRSPRFSSRCAGGCRSIGKSLGVGISWPSECTWCYVLEFFKTSSSRVPWAARMISLSRSLNKRFFFCVRGVTMTSQTSLTFDTFFQKSQYLLAKISAVHLLVQTYLAQLILYF